MPSHYADRLAAAIRDKKTPAVVGIDPVLERLPDSLQPNSPTLAAAVEAIEAFARGVIDVVADRVPAIKINVGFFEAFMGAGLTAYYRLIAYAHTRGLLVIGDIKRGDIGSTARLYARGHLAQSAFPDVDPASVPDAVTLAGYLGENVVHPFIEAARETGRGMYILVRPSDPGADQIHDFGNGSSFYQHLADLVAQWGAADDLRGECGLSCVGAVVAAKDADSTAALRTRLAHTPLLVPGYGAQGGTAEDVRPCFLPDGTGAVVNASRSVIYAFAKPENTEHHREDWQSAVAAACDTFVADVAPLAGY